MNGPIIADKDMYLLYSPLFSYFFPTSAFLVLPLLDCNFFQQKIRVQRIELCFSPSRRGRKKGSLPPSSLSIMQSIENWEMVGLTKCQNALIPINFIFELCRRVGIGLALRGHFECSLQWFVLNFHWCLINEFYNS